MAINGIGSYGMGYYNYQSSINDIRLAQALANNPKFQQSAVTPVASASSINRSLTSSMNFVKEYTSSMSNLMNAANQLRTANSSGAMNDLAVTSSDTSVASATEKLPARNAKELTIDVTQLAQAQVSVSSGVRSSETASESMSFTVGNSVNSVYVNVNATNSDGTSKTNLQMIQEAADQINSGNSNVRASVIQEDGNVSLRLEGKYTGEAHAFSVTGSLGAAAGAEQAQTEAANAKYSVTADGKTTKYESYTNEVSVDSTRIGVTLKGVGQTTIRADVDVDKVASAVSGLVDAYNASLKLLNDNYDRGTGVDKQLRNLVGGLGAEASLEKLGITVNKDATLEFDKSVLEKSMKDNPSLTKDLISGSYGIANTAFTKATAGLNTNSNTLINGDLEYALSDAMSSPFNMFNMYSRGGAYNLNNYYALGMMINMLV